MISRHRKKISSATLLLFFLALLITASGLAIRHAFLAAPETAHSAGINIVQDDSLYNRIISKADNLFFVAQYAEAKSEYEKAAQLKPLEKYPKEQIRKINQLPGQTVKKQEDYQSVIASADKYYAAKDYLNAKAAYQLATEIKPDESYPKQQLAAVMEVIRSQKAQNILYDVAIANAEKFLANKDYEKAKTEFQNALNILPGAQYPKDKINEITKIRIDAQVKEDLYKQAIAKADQYFEEKILPASRTEYQKAALLKPEEKYPKERIKEIDALLAAQKGTEDAYNQAIALADKYFRDQSYPNARSEYVKVSGIKPAEAYPVQQIRKIDDLLTSQANIKLRYDQYINLADSLYILKDFAEALRNYRNALGVKPGESYPQQMIEKASKLLSNSEEEAKILLESYLAAIAEADKLFGEQSWSKALEAYQQAGNLKPAESYPKQKIKEINDLLAANKKKEDDYTTAISTGDAKMTEKAYAEALTAYQRASTIKPAEQYPKEKIAEINKLLADLKAKDDAYNEAITRADRLFGEQSYMEALAAYQSASTIKPEEAYPKTKITEINGILAEIRQRDAVYLAAIASGDKLMSEKSYDSSLVYFRKASQIKPAETYPQQKIKELNNLLADLRGRQQMYEELVTKGNQSLERKDYPEAKDFFVQAGNLLPDESYPKNKIAEIERIMAEMERLNREKYNKAIAEADGFYNNEIFDKAIESYELASGYLPYEPYPKERIRKIKKYLRENALVNILDSPVNISSNNERKFEFSPINVAARKNNYVFIRIRNLSTKDLNVMLRYGKEGQINGGIVMRSFPPGETATERLVSVREQDTWYREDNNWISVYPQGGDIEVSFIQINRATKIE
ncbi:MAG: hypothetical protein FJY10_04285 [Bacteroidetes bacterium]|nr:hypothetical protein [Bacteroidota bacterium]